LKFEDLNLIPEVIQGIRDMGFDIPTKIQTEAIPIALEGHDILASSQTGSGKTAAFAVPILQKLMATKGEGIRALILAPTRELAQQIDEHFWSLGYHTGLTSVTVYGGANWSEQEKALKRGVDIVVATPGRLLDMIRIISVDFSKLEILVLDEADRMLDMGFIPDVRNIVNRLPKKRQTVMFSATLTGRIESLAREMTHNPKNITVGVVRPASKISQYYYEVPERLKVKMVLHLADELKWKSALIFAATKRGVDQLYRALNEKGLQVTSIHGDRDQKEREAALYSFRTGKFSTIVATDVMSRGIDVDNISHIINFDVPNDLDDYIHRIGRTARAEAKGDAITFVSRRDKPQMDNFLRSLGSDITRLELPDGIDSGSRPDTQSRRPERDDRRPGRKPDDRRADRKQDDAVPDVKSDAADKPDSGKPDKQDEEGRSGARRSDRGRGRGRSGRRPSRRRGAPAGVSPDRRPDGKQNGQENQEDRRGAPKGSPKRDPDASRRPSGDRSRPKRGEPKLNADEKRIRDQQKLIERIQSPEIRGRNEKQDRQQPREARGGIWGKIKKIFGT
jgi:ATP-dependent RNA helicase RhlE